MSTSNHIHRKQTNHKGFKHKLNSIFALLHKQFDARVIYDNYLPPMADIKVLLTSKLSTQF